MRKVIVNSTPLIVLCKIGSIHILKDLYEEILIPEAVYNEVTAKKDSACLQPKRPDVIAKKERAEQYCKIASEWGKANNNKDWKYLFIPAGQIQSNSSFMNLAQRFG